MPCERGRYNADIGRAEFEDTLRRLCGYLQIATQGTPDVGADPVCVKRGVIVDMAGAGSVGSPLRIMLPNPGYQLV